MSQRILKNEDARNSQLNGIKLVCEPVCMTMGPKGGNVDFKTENGKLKSTNDGGSISSKINSDDAAMQLGVERANGVALKTNTDVGDANSTSLALLMSISDKAVSEVNFGANGGLIRKGIEEGMKEAIKILKSMATPLQEYQVRQVATVSSENKEVGRIVSDIVESIGFQGTITVDEGSTHGIYYEIVKGISFQCGFVSPKLITNEHTQEAFYNDAHVIVTDQVLSDYSQIADLVASLTTKKQVWEILIIAEDVIGEALRTFEINLNNNGTLRVLAVRAPGTGNYRSELLEDIAVTVGATVITDFSSMSATLVGKTERVVSDAYSTVIIGGKGNQDLINKRISILSKQMDSSKDSHVKEILGKRISQLSRGSGVIRIGSSSDQALSYLKGKVDDCLCSVKAAIQEGIIPGGGAALVHCGERMKKKKLKGHPDFIKGYKILIDSLSSPLFHISQNSTNTEQAYYILSKVRNSESETEGYDASGDSTDLVNMIDKGIIDPVKSIYTALFYAASDAALLATTKVAIVELEAKK